MADHLIIFEPGGVRVIDGNYDAYQQFLKSKAAWQKMETQAPTDSAESPERGEPRGARQHKKAATRAAQHGGGKKGGGESGTAEREKARRFPYRKLADIEGEISQRESRIE